MTGIVYFLRNEDGTGPIKIGWTRRDPWARLRGCQVGSPVRLRLIAAMPGARHEELQLHWRFHQWRVHGEWFEPSDGLLSLIAEAVREHAALLVKPLPPSHDVATPEWVAGQLQISRGVAERLVRDLGRSPPGSPAVCSRAMFDDWHDVGGDQGWDYERNAPRPGVSRLSDFTAANYQDTE